jgi:hypothetical protein
VSDFQNLSFNGVLNPGGGSTEFGFTARRATPSTPTTPLNFSCTAYA